MDPSTQAAAYPTSRRDEILANVPDRYSPVLHVVIPAILGAYKKLLPPELAGALACEIRLRATPSGPVLSERESQVLQAFARGLSIPQTAAELAAGVTPSSDSSAPRTSARAVSRPPSMRYAW